MVKKERLDVEVAEKLNSWAAKLLFIRQKTKCHVAIYINDPYRYHGGFAMQQARCANTQALSSRSNHVLHVCDIPRKVPVGK
jgi:hypothetical protein